MEAKTKSSSPDQSTVWMATVFDSVWTRFLEHEGSDADTPENRGLLAARIVVLFKTIGADESEIETAALIFLLALAAARRISWASSDPATPPALIATVEGGGFAPETIEAMSEALQLCLDELPLRFPAEAHVLIRTTILNSARAGERDPIRLHEAAMEALRARH